MIRRFSIFKSLCRRFPGWAVSGLILIGGSACFLAWWVSFKFRNATLFPDFAAGSEASPPVDVNEIKPDELVLCGNALLNFRSGRILTKQWLQGFGDAAPPIVKILPAEKLVICGNRGQAGAFGFDGKAKGKLTFEGKRIGAAGFSFGFSRVIWVHESNLWLGRVNWLQSTVNDAKRLSDTNYFRDDCFRSDWFWHGDALLVPVLGRTHRVDLVSGSITQDAANAGAISRGLSPDGNRTAVAFGHGNFVVMNLITGEAKQYSIRGKFREFLWLDEHRLAYGNYQNGISVLDANTGKVTEYAAPATVLKLAAASPGGGNMMAGTNKGPMIFTTSGGGFVPLDLPVNDGVWLDESSMLCISHSTDSSLRGIWRIGVNGSEERISNQPTDSGSAGTGARPMLAIPSGAVWVAGGNLWRYDSEDKSVTQVTQDQHLIPSLQILPVPITH